MVQPLNEFAIQTGNQLSKSADSSSRSYDSRQAGESSFKEVLDSQDAKSARDEFDSKPEVNDRSDAIRNDESSSYEESSRQDEPLHLEDSEQRSSDVESNRESQTNTQTEEGNSPRSDGLANEADAESVGDGQPAVEGNSELESAPDSEDAIAAVNLVELANAEGVPEAAISETESIATEEILGDVTDPAVLALNAEASSDAVVDEAAAVDAALSPTGDAIAANSAVTVNALQSQVGDEAQVSSSTVSSSSQAQSLGASATRTPTGFQDSSSSLRSGQGNAESIAPQASVVDTANAQAGLSGEVTDASSEVLSSPTGGEEQLRNSVEGEDVAPANLSELNALNEGSEPAGLSGLDDALSREIAAAGDAPELGLQREQQTAAAIKPAGEATSFGSGAEFSQREQSQTFGQPSENGVAIAGTSADASGRIRGAQGFESVLRGLANSRSTVVNQAVSVVTQTVESLGDEPIKVATVELQPIELGKLSIRVEQVGDTITATILASEMNTSDLLESEKSNLEEALADLGYDQSSVDVAHGESSDGEDSEQQGGSRSTVGIQAGTSEGNPIEANQTMSGLNIIA